MSRSPPGLARGSSSPWSRRRMSTRAPWGSPPHSASGLCSRSTREVTIHWGCCNHEDISSFVASINVVILIDCLQQELDVQPYRFDERRDYIGSMVLHIDFFSKKKVTIFMYFILLWLFYFEMMDSYNARFRFITGYADAV